MKYLFFLLFSILVVLACQTKSTDTKSNNLNSNIDARSLFKTNCVLCHGIDGKLQMNGARDLTKSPLSIGDRIQVITNGRNTMTAFGDVLSKQEIEALAKYTLNFK